MLQLPRSILVSAVVAAAQGSIVACSDSPPGPSDVAVNPSTDVTSQRVQAAKGAVIPFAKLQLFFEFNSTDNDLGAQLLLDGVDWEHVAGVDPRGREFVEVEAGGRLRQLGLTELFWESAEPSPAEVLALIPAGTYTFSGKTVDGDQLVGTATLSHALPPAPQFLPEDGAVVDMNNFVVTWKPIAGLAAFQVIVAEESSGMTLVVDLRPSVASFKVPVEFLQRGKSYKIEVLAISTNGNKTITEAVVQTKP